MSKEAICTFVRTCFLSSACVCDWRLIALPGVIKAEWTSGFVQWHSSHFMALPNGLWLGFIIVPHHCVALYGPSCHLSSIQCYPAWERHFTLLELRMTSVWQAIWNRALATRNNFWNGLGLRMTLVTGKCCSRWHTVSFTWGIWKCSRLTKKIGSFVPLKWYPSSSAISLLLISCRTSHAPQHPPCAEAHSACILTAESNQTFTEKGKAFVLIANWHHISFMQNTTPIQSVITYLYWSSALKCEGLKLLVFTEMWNQ